MARAPLRCRLPVRKNTSDSSPIEAAIASGERIKAYIVLKPGQTATADEIKEFCKERLTNYKRPTFIEFRDSLPKTMVGKILRRQLVAEDKEKAKQQ